MFALSYADEEIFAEKIRALGDRARPRDLYDVIHLFRQLKQSTNNNVILDILKKKCAFKKIDLITEENLEKYRESCKIGWESQLTHQISVLPTFHSFWDELPAFFSWLHR